jgi:hypothetical protein
MLRNVEIETLAVGSKMMMLSSTLVRNNQLRLKVRLAVFASLGFFIKNNTALYEKGNDLREVKT